jgi:cytochrome P450
MRIADLPRPRALPVVGHLLQMRRQAAHLAVEAWSREVGPLFRVSLGGRPFVGVADPDLIRQVLNQRPDTFRRSSNFDIVFGDLDVESVFAAEGSQWRRLRRLWLRALNSHQIAGFAQGVGDITERLRARWQAAANRDEAVDIQGDLTRYTVDVTTLMTFGFDGNTLQQRGAVIQDDMHHVFPMISRRLTAPFPYWHYIRLPRDRQLDRAMVTVTRFVDARIAEARERIDAHPELQDKPSNLLEAFLVARDEDGSLLSDAEIRGNTLTALLAGEDTTANTLAWSLHLLSHNPAAQERLQAEADAVVGRARCARSMAQLATLPWCDAVMAESLRLKPVAPMFFKTALKDTRIGDLDIPRGTHLILDMRHGADQDARYDQPAQFDPARWLADDAPRFEAASPMPFGAGPRICPGRNLAQLEVRSVLSMIGRSFELHTVAPEDSVTERFGFTMAPAGLRLKLTARG